MSREWSVVSDLHQLNLENFPFPCGFQQIHSIPISFESAVDVDGLDSEVAGEVRLTCPMARQRRSRSAP
jgi:hypothetical protein